MTKWGFLLLLHFNMLVTCCCPLTTRLFRISPASLVGFFGLSAAIFSLKLATFSDNDCTVFSIMFSSRPSTSTTKIMIIHQPWNKCITSWLSDTALDEEKKQRHNVRAWRKHYRVLSKKLSYGTRHFCLFGSGSARDIQDTVSVISGGGSSSLLAKNSFSKEACQLTINITPPSLHLTSWRESHWWMRQKKPSWMADI